MEQYIGNAVVGIVLLVLGFILNSNINSRFTKIETDIATLRSELRGEIGTLRDMLVGKIIEHGERITKLEK